MSVWLDMAHAGGYRGEEAEMVARQLEEQERQEHERREAEMYAAMEADYWREAEARWCETCERAASAEGCPACGDDLTGEREGA